jgi:capsular polysaccharide biosynthesis protein/GGDEF domain-containing protein
MEIKMYIRMLQRGWWLIVLCSLVALTVSLVFSYYSEPVYLATARFVASPDASFSQGGDIINSINTLDKRSIVTTYSVILGSDTIYRLALEDLKISTEEVEDYVRSVVVLPESNVLEVYVEGGDPAVAASIANNIGKQSIFYIDGLNQGFNIRLLDPAQVSTEPIRPRPVRDASLALLLGLVLGFSLAIIRDQLISPIAAFLKRNTVDQDSGAFSRNYFEQKLDETLERSALVGFHTLGLIYLEGVVEYLGVIPKPLEHQMFRQISKILRNELRGNDIVGRWDDATFAVLLPGTPGEAAVITLGRVQSMLSAPIFIGDTEVIYLNPRIGLTERVGGESSGVLRENAEISLKKAISGNTGLVFYQPDSSDRLKV